MESFTSFIGLLAGCLTTFAFLPQVIKTWQSRSTKDLSLPMWLVLFVGISLWLVYGILKMDFPLLLANSVTLFLAGIVLFLKIRNG
ncbi:MAG: hypothetical protein CMM44_10865 [Rhodospirillaceae bacterium]|nr:hypothetical protein [Rhodospirillaceae bacterium]|tara:strand:- start:2904 stop:3161 length:258 start_codon:yes stop_codon:yes gene_type:complete